jgi:hypothetical protein
MRGWPSGASPIGVSRSALGVAAPSGPGEPATDDFGVFSFSLRRPRRLKGLGCGRCGVEIGAVLLTASCVPFTLATMGLPAAVSMTASCACERGSLGDPSYKSTDRGITFLRFSILRAFSNMVGLKRPC